VFHNVLQALVREHRNWFGRTSVGWEDNTALVAVKEWIDERFYCAYRHRVSVLSMCAPLRDGVATAEEVKSEIVRLTRELERVAIPA
jgi:hypothetical protein